MISCIKKQSGYIIQPSAEENISDLDWQLLLTITLGKKPNIFNVVFLTCFQYKYINIVKSWYIYLTHKIIKSW